MREVIRCRHCHLNQFMTGNGMCRKCRLSLHEPVPDVAPVAIALPRPDGPYTPGDCMDIPGAVKLLRLCNMLTQKELAEKAGVPRTYISKIETGTCLPTLDSMQNIADGLGVGMFELIQVAAA